MGGSIGFDYCRSPSSRLITNNPINDSCKFIAMIPILILLCMSIRKWLEEDFAHLNLNKKLLRLNDPVMNFEEFAKSRKSTRGFLDKPISKN